MAVESADDLEGFFDPDEFGEEMTLEACCEPVTFSGIYTSGHVGEQAGGTMSATLILKRIIVRAAAVPGVDQGQVIVRANGDRYTINDIHEKGSLLIFHLHEPW